MSTQTYIDKRTEKLRTILSESNTVINNRSGTTADNLSGLPTAIASIPFGSAPALQQLLITQNGSYTPELGFYGIGRVRVAVSDTSYLYTTAIDYSAWDSGTFTETLSTADRLNYTVTFDDAGQPTAITAPNGTVTAITWEVSG